MNLSKTILHVAILMFFCISIRAEQKILDTTSINARLDKFDENVKEIRRDQLNYQIERDLLKEAFSSNYQTVNIVLAIVLGLFSLIGFLGLRDIGAIKKDYIEELEKLNTLRKDFEIKVELYEAEQKKALEKYSTIVKTNDEQNRRIKILELQEKIASLMHTNNYQRALEYLAVALEMDPNNAFFYLNKGLSLWRVGDLSGAISAYTQATKLDADDLNAVMNLIELYLLTKRFDDFEALYSKNKQAVITRHSAALSFYFEALELFLKKDLNKLKSLTSNFIATVSPGKQKRTDWDFKDALKELAPKPDEQLSELLLLIIEFLRGEVSKEEVLNKI